MPVYPDRPLTRIELTTLHLASQGLSYRWIAAVRGRGVQTVKKELAGIRRRLGARTTPQAVAVAMRQGLI
jgi:DNA-binding CsgD family transcriptional regulator